MQAMYCCKRCVNGREEKFSSPVPCSEGYQSLPCNHRQNPCLYYGGGTDSSEERKNVCKNNCSREYEQDSEEFRNCIIACEKTYQEEKSRCTKNSDCGTGKKCISGKCVDEGAETGCGKGKVTSGAYPNGRDWEGCPCSAAYFPTTPGQCQAGYSPVGVGADARCECDKYDAEVGTEETKQGGTFEFSPDVKALMARLMQRANWLLDNPGGMTAEERAMIQNRAAEGIKGAERGILTSTRGMLGRMGLLGSGVQLGEEGRVRRGTTQALAASQRDIAIEEAARKVQDLLGTTGLASTLSGGGMAADQMVEALNAARRGESRDWTSMLLNYLSNMMSGSNSAYNYYNQAIAQRYNTPTQQGTSAQSWLPYLLMMMGMK